MSGRGRIAVVEDDASMRRALRRLFTAAGYECAEFESGEALLRLEPFLAFDCLVCDVYLPGVTGFELVRMLRERSRQFAVVFITGFDSPDLRACAARLEDCCYLAKPFVGAELLAKCESIIK